MAYEIPGFNHSFVAGEDLRTAQYKFVKLNSNGEIVLCTVDGELALGILQDTPNAGEIGNVMLFGISKVIAAASEVIPAGAAIGTTTLGTATRVDATGTGADVGDMMMGLMLAGVTGTTTTGAALGTMLLRPTGRPYAS